MTKGCEPKVKNVVTFLMLVGNNRQLVMAEKMNQGQPHPRVFLKCKNSFLCVKCMACSKSILVDTWQL
jgi:uncharacterized Zn-finger protein